MFEHIYGTFYPYPYLGQCILAGSWIYGSDEYICMFVMGWLVPWKELVVYE